MKRLVIKYIGRQLYGHGLQIRASGVAMKAKYLTDAAWASSCAATVFSEEPMHNRKPYAAGRFYPDKPFEVNNQLQQFFSKLVPKKNGNTPLAIIVPHAGYVFSGEIAASAYHQIDPNSKFERIFIIGSSHTSSFPGASLYCSGHYETPLGTVKVDLEFANQLAKENKLIRCYPEAHLHEHSLEVQLPFLQYLLNTDFKIVPIIIGSPTVETAWKLATILKPYLNEKNLFVISSDFSHYPNYKDACKVDQLTAEAIQTNKAVKLMDALECNDRKNISGLQTSLCGWSSVLTLLYMTEEMQDITIDLLQYKNSGDSSYGDKDKVVGYYAIAFFRLKTENPANEFSLNNADKTFLLQLAREAISGYIRKGTIPEVDQTSLSEALKAPGGAFVSLYKKHNLMACLGSFSETEPLWKVVQSKAIAAATRDYRFGMDHPIEISQLKIEISVLTPLKQIHSADELILGKHGIRIVKGFSSGTFLPQVAAKTGWSKEEFLGHCARDKAGIGWNDWKTAKLYTYEALVFSEEED